jgi:hypothetical protein
MRRTVCIVALVASHGAALWLGKASPPSGVVSEVPLGAVPAPKQTGNLAAFLRGEEGGGRAEEEAEAAPGEGELVAAARAAIPADADVAAMVKAGAADPDLELPPEILAAFGLWMDRDPVAALRWFAGWPGDGASTPGLVEEVGRHLGEGGAEHLALYLKEVPALRDFLIDEVELIADRAEPEFTLRLAATLGSATDRLEVLSNCFGFGSLDRMKGHLAEIRRLLDDGAASEFLGTIGRVAGDDPELVSELERAGFPAYAIGQLLAEHWHRPGQYRTNADFISTVEGINLPGIPAATGNQITDIVTTGRSDDGPIGRSSIDAVLNNPNRTPADSSLAEGIRKAVLGSWDDQRVYPSEWMVIGEIAGYEEGREDFLRGKITAEEWCSILRDGVPEGADLANEIATLAFRACVEEDPRKAASLISAAMNGSQLLTGAAISSLSPEAFYSLARSVSGSDAMSPEIVEIVGNRFASWSEKDPAVCADFIRDLPAGPLRELLAPMMEEGE